ncbi:hypothetical protein HPB49_003784 [Dermacentor silvarum]|uniref:Uncharacterized protein n=1 Tax=Dermacentor silvarum TaxID=543639 RepID=A0ACB8CJH0_DERSI|nr:hypothetical protein HPB49_003784 [Dermacentor silvarum]
MSCIGLAQPPPFLHVPGRPPVPWLQWHRMFENFLLASGASDCKPERRKALLIHSLGVEGQRVFSSLLLTSDAAQSGESTAGGKHSNVQRISGHSRLALNDHRGTGTRHPSSRDDAPLRAPGAEASLQHDSRQPASYLRPYNSSSHCYRCGSRQHRAASPCCPGQGQRCYRCGLIGHFSAVCKKKKRAVTDRELSDQTLPDNETDNEAVNILCVTASGRAGILVEVAVGHATLTFLIDSGSSVSIPAGDIFNRHFAGKVLLSAPRVKLLHYSKKPIPLR